MPKLESKTKENPKLEQSTVSGGRISLYLSYYLGRTETPVLDEAGNPVLYESGAMAGKPKFKVKHNRKKEVLNLYLNEHPRTPGERQTNRDTLELAQKIRFEREQELKAGTLGYRLKAKRTNFFDFIKAYYENYTKADKRMIKCAVVRFESFINAEYPMFAGHIPPERVNGPMMEKFVTYLQEHSKGEGAVSHWKRWKKIVRAAIKEDVLINNPCEDVICKADEGALTKDILSLEEIEKLINTDYPGLNRDIRRAFIFTLYTGIRFCDINELRYSNVDYANKLLTFNQCKTRGHSAHSYVTIPLNAGLLSLIGAASADEANGKIFNLPSNTACLKALRHWTAKAGITKHITWHCGRHSFATNILMNGANIKTVAALLGHSGLKHTEKYVRAVDSLKQEAINSLPELNL